MRYFRFLPEPVTVGGVPVWLSRTGFSGELGFELFLRPEHADDLWAAVEAAGATPYGVEVIEPLRVETGMIVTDYDYAEHERTPYDLGMDRVVALGAPGAFMGKDRLRSRSRPTHRTASRRCAWTATRSPSTALRSRATGEEVGVLTSPAISPKLGNIGLAILRSDVAVDGGAVEVALGDGTVARDRSTSWRSTTRRNAGRGADAPERLGGSIERIDDDEGKGREMTDEERRSPLHDVQVAAGAEIIWEDGWPWAMTVGDTARNEYEAIRTATGLWDLFSTVKYEVTGPDASRLIQRRFTNDLVGGRSRAGALRRVRERRRADGRRRQRLQALRPEVLGHGQHGRVSRTGSARPPTDSMRGSSAGPRSSR